MHPCHNGHEQDGTKRHHGGNLSHCKGDQAFRQYWCVTCPWITHVRLFFVSSFVLNSQKHALLCLGSYAVTYTSGYALLECIGARNARGAPHTWYA